MTATSDSGSYVTPRLARSGPERRKITDLERFAFEEVMRPYGPLLGYGHLKALPVPMGEIPALAGANPEWWSHVTDRLWRCGFWFPTYLVHPLVDLLTGEVPDER